MRFDYEIAASKYPQADNKGSGRHRETAANLGDIRRVA
jgi:hypothetical protein